MLESSKHDALRKHVTCVHKRMQNIYKMFKSTVRENDFIPHKTFNNITK